MNTLITRLAWRNIWRNSRRTTITLVAMVLSVGFMIWMITFMDGFHLYFIQAQLDFGPAALQVHAEGYQDDKKVEDVILDPAPIVDALRELPGVEGVGTRLNTFGLASHGNASQTVMLVGTDPSAEPDLSFYPEKIKEGEWLPDTYDPEGRLPIVIGQAMAEKLEVELGDRVFLMVQGLTGDVAYAVYFVHGIFRTGINELDKNMAWVPIDSLRSVLAADVERFSNAAHEVTVQIEPNYNLDLFTANAVAAVGERSQPLEVLNWQQMQPGIMQAIEMDDYFIYIMMIIIFAVVAVGIMNTLLMAVFERIREFGIMMSLGSKPAMIFKLVTLESLLLGLIGAIGGLLFGLLLFYINMKIPWDFSNYKEMGDLVAFDYTEKIYPTLVWSNILKAVIGIYIFTILASIWPAYWAKNLKPVDALRHV